MFCAVPCGSRLAVLLSVLKHLFEKEASNKVILCLSNHYCVLILQFL